MSKDNQNKSMHFFNLVAFKNYITGNNLPDSHSKALADVPISSFLPSMQDLADLKKGFCCIMVRCDCQTLQEPVISKELCDTSYPAPVQ